MKRNEILHPQLVCGYGTEECKQIKANGGKTFAQDSSADVEFMSLRAQQSVM